MPPCETHRSMGTVYEALHEKPRRTVAVKLMRAGVASRSALRRFEYESQLLARFRHAGIGQVHHRFSASTAPHQVSRIVRHVKIGVANVRIHPYGDHGCRPQSTVVVK